MRTLFLLSTDNCAADTALRGVQTLRGKIQSGPELNSDPGSDPGSDPNVPMCAGVLYLCRQPGGFTREDSRPCRLSSTRPGFVATVGLRVGSAQQTVPFQGGIPLAPSGLAKRPLPDKPMEFDTGRGPAHSRRRHDEGPEVPLGPHVSARRHDARDRAHRPAANHPQRQARPAAGTRRTRRRTSPASLACPAPCTATWRSRSIRSSRKTSTSTSRTRSRSTRSAAPWASRAPSFDGKALTEVKDIFVLDAAGTTRIAFGKDGMLYVTTTGRQSEGSELPAESRLTRAARSFAFATMEASRRTTRSRERLAPSPRSIRSDTATSSDWPCIRAPVRCGSNENGPNGGDEINILKPGANYGWPLVSYGRTYPGPWQGERPGHAGFEPPIVYWMPSIAVSGMAFYTGDRFPEVEGRRLRRLAAHG